MVNHKLTGGTESMKQATYSDAESVASLLNLNKEMVWQIIRGMEYSTHNELAIAVHRALSVC